MVGQSLRVYSEGVVARGRVGCWASSRVPTMDRIGTDIKLSGSLCPLGGMMSVATNLSRRVGATGDRRRARSEEKKKESRAMPGHRTPKEWPPATSRNASSAHSCQHQSQIFSGTARTSSGLIRSPRWATRTSVRPTLTGWFTKAWR